MYNYCVKWSEFFIPTLREVPREAEGRSHILLLRGGYVRALGSGLYNYLPLGLRVIQKIIGIIREEMNGIGGLEVLLSGLTPRDIWESSGRWAEYGDDMFRLKDRKGQELGLAPTHEEIITFIAAKEIRSYRDLPQIWYQFQTKYRDEPRPRAGVVRTRQFIMKDAYSLDVDYEGLDISFNAHKKAYERIFRRLGHDYYIIEASGGIMGTGESREFMVEAESGEDKALICTQCGYKANSEVCEGTEVSTVSCVSEARDIETPDVRTVEEVSRFIGIEPFCLIKTMLFIDKTGKPFIVLIRGDYDVSTDKLSRIKPGFRMATNEEALSFLSAPHGFLGPYGVKNIDIFVDLSLKHAKGMVSGANKEGFHRGGIDIDDIVVKEFIDVRHVKGGDRCPKCGAVLEERNSMELGHIFKLGTRYSEKLHATFLSKEGKELPIIMGSYGIGVERSMAASVEQHSTESAIVWPITIAPFEVELISLGQDSVVNKIIENLDGVEYLYDDRALNPGVKFRDADLVGVPLHLVAGKRSVERGMVEIVNRRENEKALVKIEDAGVKIKEMIERERLIYDR